MVKDKVCNQICTVTNEEETDVILLLSRECCCQQRMLLSAKWVKTNFLQ